MAEDAAQEERLRRLRDPVAGRYRGQRDRAGDHRELPDAAVPAQRARPRAADRQRSTGASVSTTGRSRSSPAQRPSATTTASRAAATGCSSSDWARSRSPSPRHPRRPIRPPSPKSCSSTVATALPLPGFAARASTGRQTSSTPSSPRRTTPSHLPCGQSHEPSLHAAHGRDRRRVPRLRLRLRAGARADDRL